MLGLLFFPLEDPQIDVDGDLRPLFEPPEEEDEPQKDDSGDFLPLFEPRDEDEEDEPQKDDSGDFLPLFEPLPRDEDDFLPLFEPLPRDEDEDDEPQKVSDGDADLPLLPFLRAGGDALGIGCESGELGTRSTTYRFPQLRFRFFWSGDSFAFPVLTSTSFVSFFPVNQFFRLTLKSLPRPVRSTSCPESWYFDLTSLSPSSPLALLSRRTCLLDRLNQPNTAHGGRPPL